VSGAPIGRMSMVVSSNCDTVIASMRHIPREYRRTSRTRSAGGNRKQPPSDNFLRNLLRNLEPDPLAVQYLRLRAAFWTSSVEAHCASLTSVCQRSSDALASGCLPQNSTKTSPPPWRDDPTPMPLRRRRHAPFSSTVARHRTIFHEIVAARIARAAARCRHRTRSLQPVACCGQCPSAEQ
jgi:hypothetical protein